MTSQNQDTRSTPILRLDRFNREVYLNGEPLPITLTQYRILKELVSRQGTTIPTEILLEKGRLGSYHNLQVHICRLRKALGQNLIVTSRSRGYRLLIGNSNQVLEPPNQEVSTTQDQPKPNRTRRLKPSDINIVQKWTDTCSKVNHCTECSISEECQKLADRLIDSSVA